MCGICGIRLHDRNARVDPTRIARMSATLVHRGPDDEGYHIDRNVGLGHRRLSIIDLEGGKQPIYNEDRSIAVVFNGEIYNYRELRSELQGRGHRFRTGSDTEVIVHAYEEYGDACVDRFRGMFAFAIADSRRRRLLLARDRLGIKPLYYHDGRDGLAFASEIKALLELPELERDVDPIALDLYLSLRYVPGPRTMFRNVRKLPPGHLLVAEGSGVTIRKYWELDYEPAAQMSFDDARDRLVEILDEAVRLRMIADVPLGLFLSGGLDSSVILAAMTELSEGNPVRSFSVGYAEPGDEAKNDERGYAKLAADRFGSVHRELELDAADFGDFLPRMVWQLDEPMADPTCAPLYFLSRMARREVTVVLSGEGADEILGGYGIYRRMAALQAARRLVPDAALNAAARLAPMVPGEAARTWIERLRMPLEAAYTGVSRAFRPAMKSRLLGRGQPDESAIRDALAPHYAASENASTLTRMLHLDTKVWLPDDLLLKADRMTMANSMELRVPFLDHVLVEFAASLPDRWKVGLRPNDGKRLLRHAFKGVLPDPIVSRAKKGFPVPTGSWLRGSLAPMVRDTLDRADSACARYMDGATIRRLVLEHEKGTHDRTQEVWALLVFESWHRQFVSARPPTYGPPATVAGVARGTDATRAVPPHAGFPPAGQAFPMADHGESGS